MPISSNIIRMCRIFSYVKSLSRVGLFSILNTTQCMFLCFAKPAELIVGYDWSKAVCVSVC